MSPKGIRLSFIWIALCLCHISYSQSSKQLWDTVTIIQRNPKLSSRQVLEKLHQLEKLAPELGYPMDSSYARLLHAIAVNEYFVNHQIETCLRYTQQAINVNIKAGPGFSPQQYCKSTLNLGYFYDALTLFPEALQNYDSAIARGLRTHNLEDYIMDARMYKAYVFFRKGDYQKAVEESSLGLELSRKLNDSLHCVQLLNQRAQSLFFQKQMRESFSDLQEVIMQTKALKNTFQLASAYKIMGYYYASQKQYPNATKYFQDAIKERMKSTDTGQIAGDYSDFGDYYRDSLQDYKNANKCYLSGIKYAQWAGDSIRLGRIYESMSEAELRQKHLGLSEKYIQKSFALLKISSGNDPLQLETVSRISSVGNKELIFAIIQNKTVLLLNQYKQTKDKRYLNACLKMAKISDSVLTQARHEQFGENSKLYWRNRTRGIFVAAIEACDLANDTSNAFYFMEKSRAVLLNDKLHELGAYAHLPVDIGNTERKLQNQVISELQKLNTLPVGGKEYQQQQVKLFAAREQLEQFIKTLDKNYPAYYQYKYADQIPTLQQLQIYLGKTGQTFVHFFNGDSAIYSMIIEPNKCYLKKMVCAPNQFEEIETFVQLCSDKERLNGNYNSFSKMAFNLYKLLFEPLRINKGRVIICEDNYLLPFDAFCSDSLGKKFLLNDYVFSYVYSAGNLLKKSNSNSTNGNFIGFAPVHFESGLNVADLNHSENSLETTARQFNSKKLMLGIMSSKKNFLQQIPGFSIATVYSHARADSADAEPVLYMQDSVIHLSELQLLHDPATKLVVLGACQTNVGKIASGEGIFSLARGFASAGIPSVAATLWNADEKAVYSISENFHRYIARGLEIDLALRKAKMDFIESGSENRLPYLWANIVVIGNAEPISFRHTPKRIFWSLLPELIAIMAILLYVQFRYNKNKKQVLSI
ncbi:MAG: hypothetical protein C5B52_10995 [Bacteroidetes bacterium]|nr:MAG: hypothetical protein C5B52_10995 [Bacteroidota bacterium]